MPAREKADWLAVESDYRGTSMAVTAIAEKHGVTESAVRKQITRRGWIRDPGGLKAQRVAAALATQGASNADGPDDEGAIEAALQQETDQDVRVMRKGAQFFADVLDRVSADLPVATGWRDYKGLTETGATAVTQYRKLRGLDDRPVGKSVEDLLSEL